MSTGLARCMYCEDSAGTDIDHFRPKSRYPEDAFRWSNYLWACSHCNSNEKRSEFPLDAAGRQLLLKPTNDDPYQHFQFIAGTGRFEPLTPRAEKTDEVFGLNRREVLAKGRRNCWTSTLSLVSKYASARTDSERRRCLETLREHPFQAVVQHFFRDALAGRKNIPADVRKFVKSTQAVWAWAL